MNQTKLNHHDVQAGGPLDEARLAQIRSRALHLYGDAPPLVSFYEETSEEPAQYEVHAGCVEAKRRRWKCGTCVATVPGDGADSGETAIAIAHAGRDLLDLVAEVERLREEVTGLRDMLRRWGERAQRQHARAERAAVVAYLRGWGQRIGGADEPSGLADEIEQGLHRRAL